MTGIYSLLKMTTWLTHWTVTCWLYSDQSHTEKYKTQQYAKWETLQ